MHMDHGGTTPVIAKHDYEDGDEVPGSFFAMGPGIKKGQQFFGFPFTVYDVAPTILHLYGIQPQAGMKGRVLTEIFVGNPDQPGEMKAQVAPAQPQMDMEHHHQ